MAAVLHFVAVGLALGGGRPTLRIPHAAATRWGPTTLCAKTNAVADAEPVLMSAVDDDSRTSLVEESPAAAAVLMSAVDDDSRLAEFGEESPLPAAKVGAAGGSSVPAAASDGVAEGRILMLVVACLWGTNFPAVKAILEAGVPPSIAAASRFGLAAVALAPLLWQGPKLERELVVGGMECGLWLAVGYIAQALALRDTPSAVVAFIASLQVVLVPLTLAAFGQNKISPRLLLSCALCVGGVGLLEFGPVVADMLGGGGGGSGGAAAAIGAGAAIALLQPVGFGVSYIRIEALMNKFPQSGLQLSALQLISNAVVALSWVGWDLASGSADTQQLAGLFSGLADTSSSGGFGGLSSELIGGIAYTGLVSTALTVVLQTRALGKLPAADSSVIVASEPLWAAGFAALLLGETLTPASIAGGLLLLSGCLANTVLPEHLGQATGEQGKEQGGSAGGTYDDTLD